MGGNLLTNNPFAILTFIAAPAILTNATSVLALSTINRMLRTRDRMHETLIRVIIGAGLLLGFVGVGGLMGGCVHLFHATQLSLLNIREEAALIRVRCEPQKNTGPAS